MRSGRSSEPDTDGQPANEPLQGPVCRLHQQAGQRSGQSRQGHLTDEVKGGFTACHDTVGKGCYTLLYDDRNQG